MANVRGNVYTPILCIAHSFPWSRVRSIDKMYRYSETSSDVGRLNWLECLRFSVPRWLVHRLEVCGAGLSFISGTHRCAMRQRARVIAHSRKQAYNMLRLRTYYGRM